MLDAALQNARDLLTRGVPNEAAVSQGVVLPVLQALGWPVFDPGVVCPEYRVEGRRVDFALMARGQARVFIEVKQPGKGANADRQLFEYAFIVGVPMAILVDGAQWHFYLPAEQGSYTDRRVYLLDLGEREPIEAAERLRRYLAFDAVAGGEAYERARGDYRSARRRRETAEALPRAWRQLVEGPSPALVALLAEEAESLGGYRPDEALVRAFLKGAGPEALLAAGLEASPEGPRSPLRRPAQPSPEGPGLAREVSTPPHQPSGPPRSLPRPGREASRPVLEASALAPEASPGSEPSGFWIGEAFHPARTGVAILLGVFRALTERDPSFPERLAQEVGQGKRRRFVARSPEEINPSRPDLAGHARSFAPGWWVDTNTSTSRKLRLIEKACRVAGLRWGTDVRVRMPGEAP